MKPFMAQELPVPDPADLSMWSHLGGKIAGPAADTTVADTTTAPGEGSEGTSTPDAKEKAEPAPSSDLGPLSSNYRDCPTTYDLFGVVNHDGAYGAGHYTAFVKRYVEGVGEDGFQLSGASVVVPL